MPIGPTMRASGLRRRANGRKWPTGRALTEPVRRRSARGDLRFERKAQGERPVIIASRRYGQGQLRHRRKSMKLDPPKPFKGLPASESSFNNICILESLPSEDEGAGVGSYLAHDVIPRTEFAARGFHFTVKATTVRLKSPVNTADFAYQTSPGTVGVRKRLEELAFSRKV